jgi:hypothetical protein
MQPCVLANIDLLRLQANEGNNVAEDSERGFWNRLEDIHVVPMKEYSDVFHGNSVYIFETVSKYSIFSIVRSETKEIHVVKDIYTPNMSMNADLLRNALNTEEKN